MPRLTSVLALLLTLMAAVVGMPALTADAATSTPKILIYGDSTTQGSSGDATWRCRLWRHLGSAGVVTDFVGPRSDLWAWRQGGFGSTAYAGSCDRDHAAVWGMTFGNPTPELSPTAIDYEADVVIGMIGGNDLVGGTATPDEVAQMWRRQITQIRSSRPGTDFVLVSDPDVWLPNIADGNAALVGLAGEMDTAESRVVMTANPNFDEVRDTIDNMHPSANGEVRIAAVVADALAGLGLGSGWPNPAMVAPGPYFATTPRLHAGASSFTVTWALQDYADAFRVWWRDTAPGSRWAVGGADRGTSWSHSALPGHTYAVRLQPRKGRHFSGTLSTIVRVSLAATQRHR